MAWLSDIPYSNLQPTHARTGLPSMNAIALSLMMKRLSMWVDRQCQPEGFFQKQFDASPFGNCYVTIDPQRQGPFASSNYNRVHICGTESGMEADGLDRLIELFTTKDVKRFFVWLSPGPDMDVVRKWLEERGLSRMRRTGYPTCAVKVARLSNSGPTLQFGR
jgi:hypothetical protein